MMFLSDICYITFLNNGFFKFYLLVLKIIFYIIPICTEVYALYIRVYYKKWKYVKKPKK